MADQPLKVWAKETIADPVKGNNQLRTIRDDEWVQGLGRLSAVTNQIFNSLIKLLTQHSAPESICPYLVPTGTVLNTETLHMNGQLITAGDQPVLHSTYGDNLPDMDSDAPTGFIYVVRNQ